MWLEACAGSVEHFPELPFAPDPQGVLRIDWAPLLGWLSDERRDTRARAGALHSALADAMLRIAGAERERTGAAVVGLTGGVFQNRLLTELADAALSRSGFRVLLAERVPCNDGGLSYGQVADFLGRNV
jgi:hydrogenase maturation protein HypF